MTATHPDYAVVSFRDQDEERKKVRARGRSRRRIRLALLSLALSPRAVAASLPPQLTPLSFCYTHSTPARRAYRRVQPAQEHAQVVQRDVSWKMREKREREAIDEERSVPLRGLSFSRANSRGEAPSLFFFRPRPHLSPLSLSLSLSLKFTQKKPSTASSSCSTTSTRRTASAPRSSPRISTRSSPR